MARASCSTTEDKGQAWPPLPFGEWVGKINELDEMLAASLRRRCSAALNCASGRSRRDIRIEELEQILAPMAEDGKETLASMGDDTPSAVLSKSTAR